MEVSLGIKRYLLALQRHAFSQKPNTILWDQAWDEYQSKVVQAYRRVYGREPSGNAWIDFEMW